MDIVSKLFKWWGIGFLIIFLSGIWEVILVMSFFVFLGFLVEKSYNGIKKYIKSKEIK